MRKVEISLLRPTDEEALALMKSVRMSQSPVADLTEIAASGWCGDYCGAYTVWCTAQNIHNRTFIKESFQSFKTHN